MKKIFLITLVISFLSILNLSAQSYNTGIGLRGGLAQGITAKHFLGGSSHAVEGILSTRWEGFLITGLYEVHDYPFKVDGLGWYYGIGTHIGFFTDAPSWAEPGESYTVLGVDAILGLEYVFEEIPFSIGLDWKPAINLIGYSKHWLDSGALSIRYVF